MCAFLKTFKPYAQYTHLIWPHDCSKHLVWPHECNAVYNWSDTTYV